LVACAGMTAVPGALVMSEVELGGGGLHAL
jgi:hypothetical protein